MAAVKVPLLTYVYGKGPLAAVGAAAVAAAVVVSLHCLPCFLSPPSLARLSGSHA